MTAKSLDTFPSRPILSSGPGAGDTRFEILDGLRGVAALAVLLFHLSIIGAPVLLPRGYLAVDLFFILSGFVLSHSYTSRLARLPLSQFIRMRLVRLLPLSVLGTLLGTGYFVLRAATQSNSLYSAADIGGATIFNVLLLPKPWVTQAPTDTIFPINTPLWSLSLEMMVNILWAAVLYRLPTRWVWFISAASGLTLAAMVVVHGSADLGATWPTYAGGALRALFGFCAGVLIWRHRPIVRLPDAVSRLGIALLVIAVHGAGGSGLVDVATILFGMPLIIILAVCADDRRERPLFAWLGRVSYPLYVVHVPLLMFAVGALKIAHVAQPPIPVIAGIVIVSVGLAAVLEASYDRPLRMRIRRLLDGPVRGRALDPGSKLAVTE